MNIGWVWGGVFLCNGWLGLGVVGFGGKSVGCDVGVVGSSVGVFVLVTIVYLEVVGLAGL